MNRSANSVLLASVVAILACRPVVLLAQAGPERQTLTLSGAASGGVLTLVEAINRSARHVSIATTPGESPESVVGRLAAAIIEADPFAWRDPRIRTTGEPPVTASDASLDLPGMGYVLAGTERGLGIPRPPYSLSCSYLKREDQIVIRWVNAPGSYDSVHIFFNGVPCASVPGGGTAYTVDRMTSPRSIDDLDICVVGYRGNVPSNAAAMHLSNGGRTQEELHSIPFADGVAPNWTRWGGSQVTFEQGLKRRYTGRQAMYPPPIKEPNDKPLYQLIKSSSQDAEGGIYRKFLGLVPGHTYRVVGRLNTLEMPETKSGWRFALHGAHNGPTGADLSAEQLAGKTALPDGRTGSSAGQLRAFGPGDTTRANWVASASAEGTSDAPSALITLPAGVDTITVWLVVTGEVGGVGFDYVALTDVTAPSRDAH